MVSMGSLLQRMGSSMGTQNSNSASNGSGQFSKISAATVVTVGSTPRSQMGHYRSQEKDRTGSDISLVEMGNKVEAAAAVTEKQVSPDPYEAYEVDLEDRKYLGRNSPSRFSQ
jgi:hypothetical protein